MATQRKSSSKTGGPRLGAGRPSEEAIAAELGTVTALPDVDLEALGLTYRQYRILQVIQQSVDQRGYPPSVRELGPMVGLASPSSVQHQIKALEAKGYIRRDPRRPRTLEVKLPMRTSTPPAESRPGLAPIAPLPVEPSLTEDGINLSPSAVQVPMVGHIAAGNPILAEEHIEQVMPLPEEIVGHGTLFMLEVHGDSMIDAAICDGDYVVVRQQATAENGDIVAALLDGEATVKTFKREPHQVWLLPHNPAYSPIDGNHATIMGKIVAVIRRV